MAIYQKPSQSSNPLILDVKNIEVMSTSDALSSLEPVLKILGAVGELYRVLSKAKEFEQSIQLLTKQKEQLNVDIEVLQNERTALANTQTEVLSKLKSDHSKLITNLNNEKANIQINIAMLNKQKDDLEKSLIEANEKAIKEQQIIIDKMMNDSNDKLKLIEADIGLSQKKLDKINKDYNEIRSKFI